MVKTLGEKILLRMRQLEEVKRDYEARDYDIARYVNPRRELLKDSQRYDNKGFPRGKQAYSGLANSALGIWCDGMQGHMVSQSLAWFRSVIDNPELNRIDEVQAYLQRYDEAMYGEFRRSNFYDILNEWFRDAGSIGTATLFTEEDIRREVAVHTVIHPREVFISEDMYGNVDTVFRKFFLTAKQAVDKFDEKKLSDDIKNNAKEHPEKRHEFIHAVYPNTDRMFGSILAKDKPWASVYVQKGSNMEGMADDKDGKVVKESGFDLNPYAVWRLRKNSDEIYGYSPAADAMVEIKKSHQMSKTLLEAAHMAVKSPLNVPEHMRGNVRMQPDGYNYYEKGGDKIERIQGSTTYPIAIDREEKIQRIIEDAYRVDFFIILQRSEREKTAYEIAQIQAEKSVLLGPQVDRMENEGLRKKFDIVSDIADKAGKLPDPPQILVDAVEEAKARGEKPARIDINFIGPLAQAQKRLFQMQPVKNFVNEIAQVSVVFPTVLDGVHPDRLRDKIVDATDAPIDILRTPAEIKEFRDQQAAEKAKAEAMQQAEALAEGYKKTVKAPEAGSPAEAAMGAM